MFCLCAKCISRLGRRREKYWKCGYISDIKACDFCDSVAKLYEVYFNYEEFEEAERKSCR